MKRKLLTVFLTLIATLCICFAFAACDNGGNTGSGSNSEQGNTQKPDDGGEQKPDDGGEQKPDEGGEQKPAHVHTFTVDNVCSECGDKWVYTEGLEYYLSDSKDIHFVKEMLPEGYPYNIEDGCYLAMGMGTASGDIVIPYGHEGKPVVGTGGDDWTPYGQSEMRSLTIPDSIVFMWSIKDADPTTLKRVNFTPNSNVTNIGNYMFRNCSSLTEITLPDSLTTLEERVFDGCSSLTEITLPDSLTTMGRRVFDGCSSIKSLSIGSKLVSIDGESFPGCSSLESITVAKENPAFHSDGNCLIFTWTKILVLGCNTSIIPDDGSVTSINSSAFEGCRALTNITIPDCITNLGGKSFKGCSALSAISLPEGISEISYETFQDCTSLREITIPDSVITIGRDVFHGCTELTSVIFGDNSQLSEMGSSIFKECTSLETITIPKNVTSLGSEAFVGCISLRNVIWNAENCTSAGWFYDDNDQSVFKDCTDVTITFGETIKSIPSYLFAGCKWLTSCEIPDGVASIGKYAFYGSGLTSIKLPEGLTEIGDAAFSNCLALESVNIPNSVTSIGQMAFSFCITLKSINIPDGLTEIKEDTFYCCDVLANLTCGENSQLISIKDYAFCGCGRLRSFIIPKNVSEIGSLAFLYCSLVEVWNFSSLPIEKGEGIALWAKEVYTTNEKSKQTATNDGFIFYENGDEHYLIDYRGPETEITLPQKSPNGNNYEIYQNALSFLAMLTRVIIPSNITSISDMAFRNCSSLKSIVIPNSVTSIGMHAFMDCSSLERIMIPDSVTSIGSSAFIECSSLTSIVIPDSLTEIGDYAFSGCYSLTNIVIPDSVTSIGGYAFSGCYSLTDIQFKGTVEEWEAIQKGKSWDSSTGNYIVACADGTIDKNGNVTYFEQ